MNMIVLILLVAQIATGIDGVKVLVNIPEDQAGIKEAIANMTKQNERHWVELKSELKGIKRKIDKLESETLTKDINTSASKPKPLPASTPDPEPSPTPKIRERILNYGTATAGASATCCRCCPAKDAFITSDAMNRWAGVIDQYPAYVWMRFQKPQRLAKIAFSLPWRPKKTDILEIGIVGSDDCKSDRIGHWTTLLTIKPAFTKAWEVKTWEIPLQKRVGFTCIGLMWPREFYGFNRATFSEITMWGHPVDIEGLD